MLRRRNSREGISSAALPCLDELRAGCARSLDAPILITSRPFGSRRATNLAKRKTPKALFHTYLEILSASRMRSVSADIAPCTAKATSGLVTLSNRPQVYCLSPYFHGPAPRRGPAYFFLLRP